MSTMQTPCLAPKRWSAIDYADHAGFVPVLGETVLTLLAPQQGERILDLGCGDGVLTSKLVESGADVLGVDLSAELLKAAQARGIKTRQLSGTALDFSAEFDAVFSNAALHWMGDLPAVIAGVARALKPGGRFVSEQGGFGNVAAIVTALVGALEAEGITDARARLPWVFPRAELFQNWLAAAGFTVEHCALYPRPVRLPTDMAGWLKTFANHFFHGLAPDLAERVQARALDALRPSLCDDQGVWHADYVRLRVLAHKSSRD